MKDDIIKLAREAGCPNPQIFFSAYKRFAALVAAAEREACAKVCDEHLEWPSLGPKDCAAAIRARGEDPMPLFDDWGMK
jgi:hypothetical protein